MGCCGRGVSDLAGLRPWSRRFTDLNAELARLAPLVGEGQRHVNAVGSDWQVSGAGARGLLGSCRGAGSLVPGGRGAPGAQRRRARRHPDSEVTRMNAVSSTYPPVAILGPRVPTLWSASALEGGLGRACDGRASKTSTCLWALSGCFALLSRLAGEVAPELWRGSRGIEPGHLWPFLSFCHCPQASQRKVAGPP